MKTAGRTKTETFQIVLLLFGWLTCGGLFAGCAVRPGAGADSRELPILQSWNGDFPVLHLGQLPEGQYMSRVGFIPGTAVFNNIWQALRPGERVPPIDFKANIVVYARNVEFYNRLSILKVLVADGIVEIVAMETMTARPIGDKVAMALAVIPRAEVKYIQLDGKLLAVPMR